MRRPYPSAPFRQVDGQRVGRPVELALGRRRPRNRQRARDAIGRVVGGCRTKSARLRSRRRMNARNLEKGQVDGSVRHFPARFSVSMRSVMTDDPRLSVRSGRLQSRAAVRDGGEGPRVPARGQCRGRMRRLGRAGPGGARLSLGYAWDPAWLKAMRSAAGDRADARRQAGARPSACGPRSVGGDQGAGARGRPSRVRGTRRRNRRAQLCRTQEARPAILLPLDPNDPEPVERAAYDASYKGVTDVLTLYLWRKPAFYLTRWRHETGLPRTS